MSRLATLLYGAACYAVFLFTFLYAIAFVGDFIVPKTVDRGASESLVLAVVVDCALLTLFALQHSGMARRGFKAWLARYVPKSIERSTYVLTSSLALLVLYWQWRPLDVVVWNFESPAARLAVWNLFVLGWLLVFLSTFVINHFDLFGLRQVWLAARNRDYVPLEFKERLLYRIVRHPLMLGFLIAFWSAPTMTMGHLLFAAATTAYILIAIQLEERDLLAAHGRAYSDYRARVPMIVPWRPSRAFIVD